ncbi:hypothetical protein [Hyalangium rubrum]|uniref:Lipoprotein n=1 Tax=Hyalangium rubrum TaxID=3103134 RepID=A0ABU5H673_9BACT|nr:hypothetical protein [Hyalangium sp. s54d21]MDY7228979.1 hypothetical protein [Hyalangium sp. s54d21]
MRARASLALLLTVTGCTTTYDIPTRELSRLDGWVGKDTTLLQDIEGTLRNERKDVRRLRDTEGTEHVFSADTPLVLVEADGDVIAERYVEVSVDGQHFRGIPQAAFRRTVEVPLQELESAGVRKFSLGKTVLLGTGIVVGLTAGFIAFGLAMGGTGGDSDDGGIPCGHGCSL